QQARGEEPAIPVQNAAPDIDQQPDECQSVRVDSAARERPHQSSEHPLATCADGFTYHFTAPIYVSASSPPRTAHVPNPGVSSSLRRSRAHGKALISTSGRSVVKNVRPVKLLLRFEFGGSLLGVVNRCELHDLEPPLPGRSHDFALVPLLPAHKTFAHG